MPTVKEISSEWKGIRSALGNLLCYIDGNLEKLKTLDDAYQKGRAEAYSEAYQKGLEDAWDIVRRIESLPQHGGMTNEAIAKAFGEYYSSYDLYREFTAHDAIQRIKEYDCNIYRVTHSNADKFVEVFGFAPGYEIMDDGRSYFPCFEDEFWNAEYKEPES